MSLQDDDSVPKAFWTLPYWEKGIPLRESHQCHPGSSVELGVFSPPKHSVDVNHGGFVACRSVAQSVALEFLSDSKILSKPRTGTPARIVLLCEGTYFGMGKTETKEEPNDFEDHTRHVPPAHNSWYVPT